MELCLGGNPRDQAAWDDLFNKFIECGEDWMKYDLVTKSSSISENSHTGTWALMSRKDSHLFLDYIYVFLFALKHICMWVDLVHLRSWLISMAMMMWCKIWLIAKPRVASMKAILTFLPVRTGYGDYCRCFTKKALVIKISKYTHIAIPQDSSTVH